MKLEIINKLEKNILQIISELSPRETFILNLRYNERRTQQEVADILGITNERVRQLEDRALKTINKYL
jgi:RNA polymerase sigma factor (sigma-70 family)